MTEREKALNTLRESADPELLQAAEQLAYAAAEVKQRGGKVMIVTGSGPNIHEGVTTLIAELIRKGLVDGVTTSSAVVAHELAGSLDKVKRCKAEDLGFPPDADYIPRGGVFEFTVMRPEDLELLRQEMILDEELLAKGAETAGKQIIKAAGNMAYPMGLRTELISEDIAGEARSSGLLFEEVAGQGADAMTMIGAGARKGVPVVVSVPQLVGGGAVGITIADSSSIGNRCRQIMEMIDGADLIIESAVALTQEIHDGPYECYTGHGLWSHWRGYPVTSLKEKTLYRIDLDPNLRKARDAEISGGQTQRAIDEGLPKTKLTGIPFRMEMSAFARHEKSHPIVGDIGIVWPLFASRLARLLNLELDFMSFPQNSPEGQRMREWIVDRVRPYTRIGRLNSSRPDSSRPEACPEEAS
jgi:hypothetical protein